MLPSSPNSELVAEQITLSPQSLIRAAYGDKPGAGLAAISREPIVHGKPGQASSSLTANGAPARVPSPPGALADGPGLGTVGEVGHGVQRAKLLDPGKRGLGQVRGGDLPFANEPRHLDGVPPEVVALCDKHDSIVNDTIAFGKPAQPRR